MSEKMHGWKTMSLGSVLKFNYGRSLPKPCRTSGRISVYGSNGPVGSHIKSLTQGPAVIVGRKGSIGEIHFAKEPCWPIDTTYYVDDFGNQSPYFWFWYLKHLNLQELDRATAIPGLNREDVYKLEVLVPPPEDQRRIVAKLDSLFARSRQAREELAHIPKLVERYKQAVLRSAYSEAAAGR